MLLVGLHAPIILNGDIPGHMRANVHTQTYIYILCKCARMCMRACVVLCQLIHKRLRSAEHPIVFLHD